MASCEPRSYVDDNTNAKNAASSKPCLFCYKIVPKTKQYPTEIFLKLVARFVGSPFSIKTNENSCCCDNCWMLVNSFTLNYLQYQSTKLKLDWALERLQNIMKTANRVPSRLQQLNTVFDNDATQAHDFISSGVEHLKCFRRGVLKKST